MFERDEWNERRRTEGKEGGRGGSRSCTVSWKEWVRGGKEGALERESEGEARAYSRGGSIWRGICRVGRGSREERRETKEVSKFGCEGEIMSGN